MKRTLLIGAALLAATAGCSSEETSTDAGTTDLSVVGDGGQVQDGSVPTDGAAVANPRVTETMLVSDQSGAANTDAQLKNAWGLAFGPTGTAWVAANGSGTARLYDASGMPNATLPAVTIPGPGGTGMGAPTGQVFNGNTTAFNGDLFLLATEDGTIAGWKPANNMTAVLEVDNSANANPPVYKGLTIANGNNAPRLYAADFHNNQIAVFDGSFTPVTLQNAFVDPNLPAGFAPFNVQAIGDRIFVTYAKQDDMKHDDVKGAGNGFLDSYDLNGANLMRLVSNGDLDSPWGMTMVPEGFNIGSNLILVGNFGDGKIHAYDMTTGALKATLADSNGNPLVIDGLWALVFGTGQGGTATNQLFFTAGPNDEMNGRFGRLQLGAQ